jgi:hypothetical protein
MFQLLIVVVVENGTTKKKNRSQTVETKNKLSINAISKKKEEVITIPTKNICLKAMIKICFKLRKE